MSTAAAGIVAPSGPWRSETSRRTSYKSCFARSTTEHGSYSPGVNVADAVSDQADGGSCVFGSTGRPTMGSTAKESRCSRSTPCVWPASTRQNDTPVHLLSNHYEASLSNSNPLLHPSRLYDLWHDWRVGVVYPRVPLFYEEWTENAARLYIDMDNELQALLARLPVRPGAIPAVLAYYQSTDAASLAAKLRSIEAFKGIASPMKAVDGGFIPDWESRYFTEDFPYGLG